MRPRLIASEIPGYIADKVVIVARFNEAEADRLGNLLPSPKAVALPLELQ